MTRKGSDPFTHISRIGRAVRSVVFSLLLFSADTYAACSVPSLSAQSSTPIHPSPSVTMLRSPVGRGPLAQCQSKNKEKGIGSSLKSDPRPGNNVVQGIKVVDECSRECRPATLRANGQSEIHGTHSIRECWRTTTGALSILYDSALLFPSYHLPSLVEVLQLEVGHVIGSPGVSVT